MKIKRIIILCFAIFSIGLHADTIQDRMKKNPVLMSYVQKLNNNRRLLQENIANDANSVYTQGLSQTEIMRNNKMSFCVPVNLNGRIIMFREDGTLIADTHFFEQSFSRWTFLYDKEGNCLAGFCLQNGYVVLCYVYPGKQPSLNAANAEIGKCINELETLIKQKKLKAEYFQCRYRIKVDKTILSLFNSEAFKSCLAVRSVVYNKKIPIQTRNDFKINGSVFIQYHGQSGRVFAETISQDKQKDEFYFYDETPVTLSSQILYSIFADDVFLFEGKVKSCFINQKQFDGHFSAGGTHADTGLLSREKDKQQKISCSVGYVIQDKNFLDFSQSKIYEIYQRSFYDQESGFLYPFKVNDYSALFMRTYGSKNGGYSIRYQKQNKKIDVYLYPCKNAEKSSKTEIMRQELNKSLAGIKIMCDRKISGYLSSDISPAQQFFIYTHNDGQQYLLCFFNYSVEKTKQKIKYYSSLAIEVLDGYFLKIRSSMPEPGNAESRNEMNLFIKQMHLALMENKNNAKKFAPQAIPKKIVPAKTANESAAGMQSAENPALQQSKSGQYRGELEQLDLALIREGDSRAFKAVHALKQKQNKGPEKVQDKQLEKKRIHEQNQKQNDAENARMLQLIKDSRENIKILPNYRLGEFNIPRYTARRQFILEKMQIFIIVSTLIFLVCAVCMTLLGLNRKKSAHLILNKWLFYILLLIGLASLGLGGIVFSMRKDKKNQMELCQKFFNFYNNRQFNEAMRMIAQLDKSNPEVQYALAVMSFEVTFPSGTPDSVKVKLYQNSIRQLYYAAECGIARADYYLGYLYHYDNRVKRNDNEAFTRLKKAAEYGIPIAQNDLGLMYKYGYGTPCAPEKAMYWFQKAANSGIPAAQCLLAESYRDGTGTPKDVQKALAWYSKAADQGLKIAQHCIGQIYYKGNGVEKDIPRAIAELTDSAEQEFQQSQTLLGEIYYQSNRIDKHYQKSVDWFRRAAVQNNSFAQYRLGWAYSNGHGVPQDHEIAFQWYNKSAENGFAEAMYLLGVSCYHGYGVPQSYKNALEWYQKAAAGGSVNAKKNIGSLYLLGEGIPKNPEKAFFWYKQAAKSGDAQAQYNVGGMLLHGHGCKKNRTEGIEWLRKAARQGDMRAKQLLRKEKISK